MERRPPPKPEPKAKAKSKPKPKSKVSNTGNTVNQRATTQ